MWQRLGWATLNLLLASGILLTFLLLGPSIEKQLLPVVEDFRVERIQRDDGKVWVSGSMSKVRACKFVSLTAYAAQGRADWIPMQVNFPDSSRVANRATLRQSWGPWWFELPNPNAYAVVTFVVQHECHALFLSTTTLTTF